MLEFYSTTPLASSVDREDCGKLEALEDDKTLTV
jgi:hypothetical protein